MLFEPIPYKFYEPGTAYFWVHFGLVILGFIIAVVTYIAQRVNPAPYGKHDRSDSQWGLMVNQRLGHIIAEAIPGLLVFSLIFFLYSREKSDKSAINYVFFGLFLIHAIQRSIIHSLTMRYKSPNVALGIVLGGLIPNCLYCFLNANHISIAAYNESYYYDPRFILGIILFFCGFIINRWSDWKLRSLRKNKGHETSRVIETSDGSKGYYIPHGGMFELVSCPNYFGEMVQWIGWSLATWSLAGFVWLCFSSATFLARSYHNHHWYKDHFEDYPPKRKALIPFIY